MNKLKKITVHKLERQINSDFGWLNFLSGIMISSSINTLTGFCSSNGESIFVFFISICSGISSGFFFALYQSLNKVKHEVESEMTLCSSALTSSDLRVHRITIWNKCINNEINSIFTKIVCASVSGILGLIGFIICYYDNNPEVLSFLLKKINLLLKTLYDIVGNLLS